MRIVIRAAAAALAFAGLSFAAPAWSQDLPANAEAGSCYAKVLVPPSFNETTEQVLVREARDEIEVVPAAYRTVKKEIVVEAESFELVSYPPIYKYVEDKVQIRPERKTLKVIPATYKTVTERVVVTPARVEWKPGRGPLEQIDAATGEILCRVEIPAVYKTVSKRVVDAPARVEEAVEPAQFETFRKRVIDKEARTERKIIPAKTRTIEVVELVSEAKVERTKVEPEYMTVTKRTIVQPEKLDWRPVLCETNTNRDTIRDMQIALQTRGYEVGPIDGVIGRQTREAISSFQQANGLETGELTLKTLEALGVKL